MNTNDHDELEAEYTDKRQEERKYHADRMRDELRDRKWEEEQNPPAERPTPITDAIFERFQGLCLPRPHHGESRMQEQLRIEIENLELRLAEVREQRDALAAALEKTAKDFITFRNIARENGIVGTQGLESLELADAALAAVKGGSHE